MYVYLIIKRITSEMIRKKICVQLFCFYNLSIYSYLFQMSSVFVTILILLTLKSNVHILINDSIDKRKLPVLKDSLNPKLSTELNYTCHNHHLGRDNLIFLQPRH